MDDQTIIQEVLAGRADVFRGLVERYSPGARYYFWARCGEDREIAKDLTQEAFLRAFRSIRTFQPGSSFRKWFRTICYHLLLDHLAGKKPPTLPPPPSMPMMTPCPAQVAVKRQIIQDAMRVLSSRQREVFELKYLWDCTVEEVAQVLGLPPGTVKTDLTTARRRLLEVLEKRSEL